MNHKHLLGLGLFVATLLTVLGSGGTARADLDLAGGALLGTGVDTGDAENNPYALQLGGFGELVINNVVLGIRGTRSIASDDEDCTVRCRNVKGIRSFGGDVGFEWDILMLHLGPRLGFGYLNERDGTRAAGYIEPGAVAEITLLLFAAGIDLRYRVAFGEPELNGFLAYARIGLRF